MQPSKLVPNQMQQSKSLIVYPSRPKRDLQLQERDRKTNGPLHYQVIENLRLRGVTELPVVTQILRNSEFLKLPSMPPSLCSAASAYTLCGGGHTPLTTSKGRKCSKDTQLQLVQSWQEWERGANVL